MKKYLFVINPVSGGNDKTRLINQIKQFCNQEGFLFELYKTTGENDARAVRQLVESFNPDFMVISGGDGTINMFVPLLLETRLPFGIIPAGSANGLATELGITLDNAMDLLRKPATYPLDVVSLNDETYMLHLADFGLNAMLVKRYEEEERRGIVGYAISFIKEFGAFEGAFNVKIETEEGQRKEFETAFLVIANAKMYGTGFMVNPRGAVGDGRIELCVLKEISSRLILEQLTSSDDEPENNFFKIIPVTKATITCHKPIDFQSDGEYLGKLNQVTVKVLDDPLQFIGVPASN